MSNNMHYSFIVYGDELKFQCDREDAFEDVKNYITRVIESEHYRSVPQKFDVQHGARRK